jgi:hypothetical protein
MGFVVLIVTGLLVLGTWGLLRLCDHLGRKR